MAHSFSPRTRVLWRPYGEVLDSGIVSSASCCWLSAAWSPESFSSEELLQYRSKVLVHFPRYCRGGIAVCISGLTSGKLRLTSLKTPVLPLFFVVKNTAVKNRTWWCLNSLLFPLFQRLINFNRRDVARRWFYDVIDFAWLLLLPWFTNRDFWALLLNAFVSRRKKWKLVPFARARRNKTDITEIELLHTALHTIWRSLKRSDFTRYANLMRFWTETNFGLYIAISYKFFYSWHWLWVSTWVSFTITVIIEGFSAWRIKKGPICSYIFYSWHWLWVSTWLSFTITVIIKGFSAWRIKKGLICSYIARTIYFETHSMQIQIQCNALWTKNNLRKKLAILL